MKFRILHKQQFLAKDSIRDYKYGQASIANQNKFNKTFEHTLNYNNDFSDNFNLDALVGYSYYDYTADGNQSSGKGYDATN